MSKRWSLGVLMGLAALSAWAQHFGNEWISYDKQYWSFPIMREGVYRLDSTTLANAGFPLGTVDARNIQIYGHERQVPIYIEGEDDGVLNGTDFIELYSKGNDAWLDSAVWDDPAHMSNPYYSFYNDTIQYFITWGGPGEALRMRSIDPGNYAAHPVRPWWWGNTLSYAPNYYFIGKRSSADASSSMLNEAEGYFDVGGMSTSSADATRQVDLESYDAYTSMDAPYATMRAVTESVNNPSDGACANHHLRVSFAGQLVKDTVFLGYQQNSFTYSFHPSLIGGNTTPLVYTIPHDLHDCLDSDYPDKQAISWQSLHYPRRFTLFGSAFDLDLPYIAGDTAHVSFTISGLPLAYAFAPEGMYRLNPATDGNNWHILVPTHGTGDIPLYVTASYTLNTVSGLRRVNGDGYFHDLSQNIPDSALVIISHPLLMNEALAYAHYRETNPYNAYHTVVSDIEELYQQFGGGIRRHPMSIRRYMAFVVAHAPDRPHGLFIIGKSVRAPSLGNGLSYTGYRRDPVAAGMCLIPSFGYPPSDMQFTLGLSGDNRDVTVPVGRLAARTPEDVSNYLQKVESVEAQPPAAWMKNILHFRGGFNTSEWLMFDEALESYRQYAEDTCFAGHVYKFVKNGDGIIQQAAADSVQDLVSQGVTLMTFFAHAFGGGFDITIDQPHNYQWNGKYPTMIGNSCYTGNIHLADAVSASEQFVLPPNAGAVAFISSVDVGLSYYLQGFTADFYKSFSQVNYGKSIGDHMRYAALQQLGTTSLDALNSAQTFTLHGDPTLVMNSPKQVDYAISDQDVTVLPTPVTADVDSFKVRAVVHNIGRATHAGFNMALERTLVEEGQVLPAIVRPFSLPIYQDTMVFTLPTLATTGGQGINGLEVRADLDPDVVPERDDLGNNKAHVDVQVTTGDLLPVYPYNFAITPDASPLLQASTGDPFAPMRHYVFQIDTTDLFNSPVMEQGAVNAPGGVLHWQPQSIYTLNNSVDSLVFFWRCAVDSTGNGEYNWHEFSFQHIPNRRGWGQAHYFQFKNNTYNLIDYDRPTRNYDYFSGVRTIGCDVWGNNVNLVQWTKDLEPQEGFGCGYPEALHVAVVDPFDFSTWQTRWGGTGYDLGQFNDSAVCRSRPEKYFIFRYNTTAQLQNLGHMVTQDVPDGHFLLIYTYRFLNRDAIDANDPALYAQLNSIGATNLANGTVPDSVPYIFFCKKNDPSFTPIELWGSTFTSHIDTTISVTVNAHSGTNVAPKAGPALAWDALYWKVAEHAPYDSLHVQVAGFTTAGTRQGLLDLPAHPDSLTHLENYFSTAVYPQLQLTGAFWNDSVATSHPAYLKRWQLLGAPAPECAIDPPLGYYAHYDSTYQGQVASVMVAIHNISEFDMDSLLVSATVVDRTNRSHLVHYKRNAKLLTGQVLQDTITFSTQGLPGLNTLVIEANPMDTGTTMYDQPEQYHFNNITTRRFLVQEDKENPVLDVTFDGVHILDGDIVSAQPEVQVVLDDENRTLLLDHASDTAYFKFFLTEPNGLTTQLYFHQGAQEVLHFVPATGPDNVSKVLWHPDFDRDGTYQLRVRAMDVSRNNSGDHDLVAKFEVINRPTITEVLNYPNPFTTSTRFVFTLTGHEVPTAMRIQIMTISGRVVREVSMAELGPLHVGRNITDFAWDGTDQFGDRLARGVYLYRVIAQLHGEDIEYRETQAGSYFTKGFGKMYLLR